VGTERRFGVSVVIPARNSSRYLEETVDSVRAQRLQVPHEIIVVDDASRDLGSHRLLDRLEDTGLRVLRLDRHVGPQHARNIGVRSANYEFIAPLDSDDVFLPTSGQRSHLEAAAEHLTLHQDTAFVRTRSLMFDGYDGLTISSHPVTEELVARKHHVPTSIIYRASDAQAGALYQPDILKWQDWSFGVALLATRRARRCANDIHYLPGPHHGYRVHAGPDRISQRGVSEFEMTRRTVRVHRSFFVHWHQVELNDDALTRCVLAGKPSKLEDLLFMAQDDLDAALEVVRLRGLLLTGGDSTVRVP